MVVTKSFASKDGVGGGKGGGGVGGGVGETRLDFFSMSLFHYPLPDAVPLVYRAMVVVAVVPHAVYTRSGVKPSLLAGQSA